MSDTLPIKVDFLEVKQPLGEFFVGSLSWDKLIKICESDIRKIEDEGSKEDSVDSYLGIQRDLSDNRLDEIADYVKTVDATFPTSLILAIDTVDRFINGTNIKELDPDFVEDNFDKIEEVQNAIIDYEKRIIYIRDDSKVAKILDGQHRLEGLKQGFKGLDKKELPEHFEFNLTIFFDLDIDDQAQVFSIINKAQTKVNKSLVYDLYEYARARSPQKTAHDIVRLLNKSEGPFHKKIKILGRARDNEVETIAQATLVELIINYISKKPMNDRDTLRRKTFFNKNLKLDPVVDNKELSRRFLRNFFVNEQDDQIYLLLDNYFSAVSEKWPKSWDIKSQGNILNKSTGIIALMRFLRPLYCHINKPNVLISKDEFRTILDKIELKDGGFDNKTFVPGSSGQSKLYNIFLEHTGIDAKESFK